MKVHITLKAAVVADESRREAAKALVIAEGGVRNVNEKRFRRYGILSGSVAPGEVERIGALEPVESVEIDEERHAI